MELSQAQASSLSVAKYCLRPDLAVEFYHWRLKRQLHWLNQPVPARSVTRPTKKRRQLVENEAITRLLVSTVRCRSAANAIFDTNELLGMTLPH